MSLVTMVCSYCVIYNVITKNNLGKNLEGHNEISNEMFFIK